MIVSLVAAAMFALTMWQQPRAAAAEPEHRPLPIVVATHSVLGDLTRQVTGDLATVVVMVGPDGDVHTFEPTPADGVTLASADIIFENGLGLEHWLDRLYAASGSKAKRVVVSTGITPRTLDVDGRKEEDPHIWHDVSYAMHMVEMVCDSMVQLDPVHAAEYRANATKSLDSLKKLDAWVFLRVSELPRDQRRLVTSHDTFGYFSQRYGFDLVGDALGSVSTEVSDPSAARIAELVEKVKASGVKCIFSETTHNPKLMQRIADEAGVKVVSTLYTDALGKPGTPGDTYEKMIRYNVDTMCKALQP